MRRPVLPTSASALFYTKVFFGYLRYTKRCDDFFFCFLLAYLRLTGLLTTNEQLVSSKKVLPNIAMRTSAMHAFLCHETNFFCVSTTSGLLHDVFQTVSVHPHPHSNLLRIAQCYGLLRDVKDTNTFSLCVRVHMTTGRTHVFDIRLQ